MEVELEDPVVANAASRAPRGVHPIALTRPTVTAFVGRTERGPLNEPVVVHSFDQYRRAFGGQCGYSYVPHAVQHYFLHGGGTACVVRVANRATRAAIDVPAGDRVLSLQARHPGSQEYLRVCVDYDGVERVAHRFNLVVQRLAGLGSRLVQDQEVFPGVSIDPSDPRYLVGVLEGSKLVRPSGPVPARRPDATRSRFPGEPIPYVQMTRSGSDGEPLTDYDVIGSNREGTGLFALDAVPLIDLICIPPAPGADVGVTTFVAAERYCERRRAMLVWDPPWSWNCAEAAVRGARGLAARSRNALTYFPRIRGRGDSIRCPAGLPGSGAIAGALARSDTGGVWRATRFAVTLKPSFAAAARVEAQDVGALRRCGVNALLPAAHGHVELWGDRTLAGPGAAAAVSQSLAKRRLLLFVLGAVERAAALMRDCLGSNDTPAALEKPVRAFLGALFEQGAFAGGAAEDAFFVRAASPRARARGLLMRFGVALEAPGRFMCYDVRYDVATAAGRVEAHEAEEIAS